MEFSEFTPYSVSMVPLYCAYCKIKHMAEIFLYIVHNMFIVRTNKGILMKNSSHSQHTPLFVQVFQSVIIVFVAFELGIICSSLCHSIKYNDDNVYAVNFKYNRIQTETIFSFVFTHYSIHFIICDYFFIWTVGSRGIQSI